MMLRSNLIFSRWKGETFALKVTTADDVVRLDIKSIGLWEFRFNRLRCENYRPAVKKMP